VLLRKPEGENCSVTSCSVIPVKRSPAAVEYSWAKFPSSMGSESKERGRARYLNMFKHFVGVLETPGGRFQIYHINSL
jgi:hypothetical protein